LVKLPADDPVTVTADSLAQDERIRFKMIDGLLYYRSVADSNDPATLRLYIPSSLRHSYLVAFHDSAGHMGVDRVCRLLRARVYWPKMSADVADHIRACHECTLAKPPPRALAHPVWPEVGEYPFDIVYCDILSMAPTHDYVKGKAGFDKLIVFVDSLTWWIEAHPFNGDPSADDVLDIFLTLVVSRHGLPRQLRADAGSNVTARLC
jgi:hypothetical protein